MQDQYVGDINDYRKYAILRSLTGDGDIRIGVHWMRTPSDGSTDGRIIGYLENASDWRSFDPPLFDLLKRSVSAPDLRRLVLIEASGVLPEATYFNELVPAGIGLRRAYQSTALAAFTGCDLIFFDPDNGLEVASIRMHHKRAEKFVYSNELKSAYEAGHSILIYQHFPRVERGAFVDRISADLRKVAPDATQWVFRTSNVAFFLLVQPRHVDAIEPRITDAASRWTDRFITTQKLSAEAAPDAMLPAA